MKPIRNPILVIKCGLFVEQGGDEHALVRGNADAIGSERSQLEIVDEQGKTLSKETQRFDSHKEALTHITRQLTAFKYEAPAEVGHRMVHGGPHLVTHQLITDDVLATLQKS